jgi:hypothetical protein
VADENGAAQREIIELCVWLRNKARGILAVHGSSSCSFLRHLRALLCAVTR